jgi:hypothetical protein
MTARDYAPATLSLQQPDNDPETLETSRHQTSNDFKANLRNMAKTLTTSQVEPLTNLTILILTGLVRRKSSYLLIQKLTWA